MKRLSEHTYSLESADFESLVSAMGDGVTVQGRDFRVIYQNQALRELVGNQVGNCCYTVYEGNRAVCPDCPVAKCFEDGLPHTAERSLLIKGEQRVLENSASPVRDRDGQIVAAVEVMRDVTLRKEMEKNVIRFMNMYAALSHTNKAIMESLCREEMFERVCHAAVEFGKFTLAVIGVIDCEGVVRSVAHCGAAARYLENLVVHADARKEEGRGPTGRAIREGKPYICNDFLNDPLTTTWRVSAQEHGIRSSAAFPLLLQGKVIGALKVYSDDAGYFDAEIVDLLTEMSANISFGLENFLRHEQRRQSEEALRASEQQLKLVLDGSNDGFCDWQIPTATVKMNNRYVEMLGYTSDELEYTPETIKALVHPDDWPRVDKFLDEELASRHPAFEIEVRMLSKGGEWKWILYRGKVVERNEAGLTTRVAGTCTDITEKKRYEERLRYASTHDPLTGLFNRAYFDTEFARMKVGRNYPVSIVITDVDGLKLVNDTYGHLEGDRLIQLAARAMNETFRADDVVARIGGDEFAVILPNADATAVKDVIKRLLDCQSKLSAGLTNYDLCVSIGSATAENSAQLDDALRQADARMYYYKTRRKALKAPAV